MEIIGKFENKLVIKCDGGYHHELNTFGASSGCFFCEHEEGTTWFDYLNLKKLDEIEDMDIIKEIISKRPKQIKY